jgi:hypothetical protein
MGAEAQTTLKIGRRSFVGTAQKDAGLTYTKVVRFSETDSAEKLVIPRAAR